MGVRKVGEKIGKFECKQVAKNWQYVERSKCRCHFDKYWYLSPKKLGPK